MKGLGEFVTRGLWQAGFCALLFALLPFLGWVALVMVALITLQKGPQEGFLVFLWACLPSIAMAAAGWHGSAVQAAYFGGCCLMVWGMAWALRRTSWALMLQLTALFALVVIVVLHSWYANFVQQLQAYMAEVLSQTKIELPGTDQQQFIANWSQNAVRLAVVSITAFSCLWVALGRWWQSVLFMPGQLQAELHNIRLNKFVAMAAVVLVAVLAGTHSPWLMDILPVALLPFSIAGLSVVHNFVAAKKLNSAWLGMFYVVLVLAIEIMAPCLAIVAVLDSWFNFRQRWQITRG